MLSPPILPIAPHQSLWHADRKVESLGTGNGRFEPGKSYHLVLDRRRIERTAADSAGRHWKITGIETDAAVWPESGLPMVFSMRGKPLPLLQGFLPTLPMTSLHEHFRIDPAPDVAQVWPDRHAAWLEKIDAMRFPFKPRAFQRDNIARLAHLDQAIVAWEPGLGKTAVAFLWPMLKGARKTLIITPASLIMQTKRFAATQFGIPLHQLDPAVPAGAGFHIASYDALFHQRSNGLLDHAIRAGFDAVILDEATIIQNPETMAGTGVWKLRPMLRLAMTATPIKNKINSLANLFCWVDPETNPSGEKDRLRLCRQWSEDYSATAIESNVSGRRPHQRVFPGNLHHLWSRAASLVLRLQKSQTGEPVAPLQIEHHMVAPDKIQWHHYERELAGKRDVSTFQKLMGIASGIYGENSKAAATNKLMQVARIAEANRGGPVLIGSTRRAFSTALWRVLNRMGIQAAIADGSSHPEQRAQLAARFRDGRLPVLIASLNSMSQGHDFPDCKTVILPGFSLAYDDNEQFLHRVWRLTSSGPITVHMVSTSHTIDQRVAEIYLDKRDQTRLVIDGGTDIPDDLASDLDRPEVWDQILALAGHTPDLTEPPAFAA